MALDSESFNALLPTSMLVKNLRPCFEHGHENIFSPYSVHAPRRGRLHVRDWASLPMKWLSMFP